MEKFRILIVEDNDSYRKLLRNRLQNSLPEIEIDEAADGHEALQKVNSYLPDLIFMDIRLPDKNGLELTKEIRATIPICTLLFSHIMICPNTEKPLSDMGPRIFLLRVLWV